MREMEVEIEVDGQTEGKRQVKEAKEGWRGRSEIRTVCINSTDKSFLFSLTKLNPNCQTHLTNFTSTCIRTFLPRLPLEHEILYSPLYNDVREKSQAFFQLYKEN